MWDPFAKANTFLEKIHYSELHVFHSRKTSLYLVNRYSRNLCMRKIMPYKMTNDGRY